jgi:hypothetical protein
MEKRFPIQRAGTVPWKDAEEAYKTYAKLFGRCQTLERLAERGGFDIGEFCCLYIGMNPAGQRSEAILKAVLIVAIRLSTEWQLEDYMRPL